MKKINNSARGVLTAATFTLLIIFGAAQAARAQLRPFVECAERERDGGGAATGNLIVYFGYNNSFDFDINLRSGTAQNQFTPVAGTAPDKFLRGVHHRAAAVVVPEATNSETWVLSMSQATADLGDNVSNLLCGDDREGANSRLITYQGKLSDGGAAANGAYDLQFQLFNAQTGGDARTTQIKLEDVAVVNGVFTVQLDLGAAAIAAGTTARRLNPAILDAENSFFEISVRAGTSTGAFTVLTPRQPLTATPLAMKATTANTAYHAFNADTAEVTQKLSLGSLNINNNDSLCDDPTDYGRALVDSFGKRLYICTTLGVKFIELEISGNYIQNTTTQQANSNFNISGGGIVAGAFNVGGTLGVGAAAPNFKLHVRADGQDGIKIQHTGTGTFPQIRWTDSTDQFKAAISVNTGANPQMVFSVGDANRLSINSDGTTNVTGNLNVTGAISGATKNFKIDHPLDPLNKTLTYTSVESPDMMNIYNGNALTDERGEAIVQMPAYFEALNKDFRYQLTVIGQFAQAIVAEEITGNTFKIKTDKPGVKVSWQVTGIRHDKFAADKQTNVEESKSAADKGKCLYAPACGKEQR